MTRSSGRARLADVAGARSGDSAARLVEVRAGARAEAAVLVLHGGGSRVRGMAVSPTQLSVLRMVPIARALARAGHGRLAVYRLLNSVRGWDTDHTPVDDVRWALGRLAESLPGLPVGLVGHSLGGRAALLSAGLPAVRSVVALAPWVYEHDGAVQAPRARVLIVHGTDDRIASPARSRAAAQRMARSVGSLSWESVAGGKHAMLSHHGAFVRPAVEFTVAALLGPGRGEPPAPPG